MTYGITPEGFVMKPMSVIIAEIIEDIRSTQPQAVFEPSTTNAQVVATAAAREYALWQLFQLLYSARNVYTASNTQLDDLVALNGIRRYAASYSYIYGTKIVGTPGTVIPVGFVVVSTVDPSIKFQTTQEYTIGASTGLYAPATYGDVTIELRSLIKQKLVAAAGTVTIVEKGIFGVEYITHVNDAVPGRNKETDEEVLARRELNVTTTLGSTVNGVLRALLLLNEDEKKVPLTYVRVFHNPNSVADTRGRPPHSMECVIEQQGLVTTRDAEIAQTILDAVGGGTALYGLVTAIPAYDYKGKLYLVPFSRPVAIPIYCAVTITVKTVLTAPELTALKLDIATLGNSLPIGTDVAVIGVNGLSAAIKNVKIVTGSILIGKTVTPADVYIDISDGENSAPERATFSTTNITVAQTVLP